MTEYALIKAGAIAEFRQIVDGSNIVVGVHATKPYLLPVVVVDPAFNAVTQVREGPVHTIEATRVLRTFTVRAKTQAEVDAMKVAKVDAVRFEGNRRMNLLVLMSKQIQALTVLVRLLYLHTDTSTWPAGQQTIVTALMARLLEVQSLRQREDDKVAEVQALTTPVQIAAYDVAAGW
jgi:hypothetical protein